MLYLYRKKHTHNLKGGYFIFYVPAVAYCIGMLAVLHIGSLSTKSSAVKEFAVSTCCTDILNNYQYSIDNSTESLDKYTADSATEQCIVAINNFFVKTKTSIEGNKAMLDFENLFHTKTFDVNHPSIASIHIDTSDKIHSFMMFGKLNNDMDIGYLKIHIHSAQDSKSLRGFDSIIEFPDKRA
jgi:hypothetical protein